MREIKFRVWSKREKELYEVEKIRFDAGSLLYVEDEVGETYFADNNDWVLMQYTGLKDAAGREIYEGDIVHAYTEESNGYGKDTYISAEIEGVVTYKGISFGIQVGNVFNDLWIHAETFEIIGNIYENPELSETE